MLDLSVRILGILAPSFVLACIGLLWFRFGPKFPVSFVTTLVINVSLPALMFHTLATAEIAISSLTQMALATLVVHILSVPAVLFLLKKAGKELHLSVALIVGNTGNLGLPVCYFAFGDVGLAYAITFFSVQCLLMFSFGDAVYAGSINYKQVASSPIFYSVVLGVLFRSFEWSLPEVVLNTTELLGQITIPLMLITLGVSLASMKITQLPSNLLWGFVSVVVGLIVSYLVAVLFGLEGVARSVLILESVVPVAVFNFLLASRHGRDLSEVSGLILVTHIAAIFYLPILLGLML